MICTRTMHVRLWCATALIAIVIGARADSTTKVLVRLTDRCPKLKEPTLVLNGDEFRSIALTPVASDRSHLSWTGEFTPVANSDETFDAAHAKASLRLGGARTDCRQSFSYDDPDQPAKIALFTFQCDERPAATVTIDRQPDDIPIHYERYLGRDRTTPESVECIEKGHLAGRGTINDVRFPRETLTLQIGLGDNPVPDAPGLRIPAQLLTANGLHLDRKGIVELQAEQRAAGNGSSPNLSPNAYDVDIRLLDESKLTNLQVTKKKKD